MKSNKWEETKTKRRKKVKTCQANKTRLRINFGNENK